MQRNLSGQRIYMARVTHLPRLTQADLAAQLYVKHQIDMSVNMLSRIENGERYVTDKKLATFARLLRVSTAWLLGETNDPKIK